MHNKYLDIDIATENGNIELVKDLYANYNIKPSLYAKQMALINGYTKMVMYIENNIGVRNKVNIDMVHKKYNNSTKTFEYDEIVPNRFRSD